MRRARLQELQKASDIHMFSVFYLQVFSVGRIWIQRRSLEYLTGGLHPNLVQYFKDLSHGFACCQAPEAGHKKSFCALDGKKCKV